MKKTELNLAVGAIVEVLCINCKILTRHKILTSVDVKGKEEMDDYETFHWHDSSQIIQCQGCEGISFRRESSNSEDYDPENEEYPKTEQIFPKRTKTTWNSKDFFNIPYNLRRIYRETVDCYNNDNSTLTAAGLRALVEGICKENGVTNGSVEKIENDGKITKMTSNKLDGKINGLYEKGKLTKDNADNLHEIRFLGNEAIHDLERPNKDELAIAIEISEHMLDSIYEVKNKAKQLKNLRTVAKDDLLK
jgi:hypothetical protein